MKETSRREWRTFVSSASGLPEMELAASGQLIITADGDLHGPDTPENRDLARRIRACINACAGLSTEELEQGLIADLCRVLGQVAPLLQKPPQAVTDRAA